MKRSRLTASMLSLSLAVLVGAAGVFGGAEAVSYTHLTLPTTPYV